MKPTANLKPLTHVQAKLLRVLADSGVSKTEKVLAGEVGVSQPTINLHLRHFKQRGLYVNGRVSKRALALLAVHEPFFTALAEVA